MTKETGSWMASPRPRMDMSLCKLLQFVMDREAWQHLQSMGSQRVPDTTEQLN